MEHPGSPQEAEEEENWIAGSPGETPMGESKTDWCVGESKTKGSALMTLGGEVPG